MKPIIALWFAFSGILFAQTHADGGFRQSWQWISPFEIKGAGMVRLAVPPDVLDASRPDLGDLRVLAPEGETPYLIEHPVQRAGAILNAKDFKVALSGRSTLIEAVTGTADPIAAVDLISPAREFLKSVVIEGRMAGQEWRTVSRNEVVFRQSGGAERMRVSLTPGVWDGLRFTVDDGRTPPVPFTGVRVIIAAEKPVTVEQPVTLGNHQEVAGETLLTLDLGARNLHVAEIRFEVSDAVFSRAGSLAFAASTPDGGSRKETIASGTIYRVAGDRGTSAEDLVIPVHRRIPARELVVTFRNGDSPPLTITGAKAVCHPTVLAFHAAATGEWKLMTGNPGVKPPHYDLVPLRSAVAKAGGLAITPGPLRANPDFKRPEALPGVETVGTTIDLTNWNHSRRIQTTPPGVIRIEPDAKALAACRSDLGDIRVVQNGRQIPYLVRPDKVTRELKPSSVTLQADPKRPTVSRWKIMLPVAGLPALRLTASSPAPMFSRRFVIFTERKDELGNELIEQVGAADWSKSGGNEVSLSIHLGGERLPKTLVLETDHGDNPPISIENVIVRFAAPVLVAKLSEPADVFLCYGNPKATPPQYDLRLVRDDLLAAEPQASTLGDEEILHPERKEKRAMGVGGLWLWVVLGLLVIALLAIVARLLPKPDDD